MSHFDNIAHSIPVWVYAILAVLIWLGLRARKTRIAALRPLLITPAIFIGWGLASVLLKSDGLPLLITEWLITAAFGVAVASMTARIDPRVVRRDGQIYLLGSWLPLARNLGIFGAKFAVTFAAAIRSDLRDQLVICDVAILGLAAGYFLGWGNSLLRAYRRASPPGALPKDNFPAEGAMQDTH